MDLRLLLGRPTQYPLAHVLNLHQRPFSASLVLNCSSRRCVCRTRTVLCPAIILNKTTGCAHQQIDNFFIFIAEAKDEKIKSVLIFLINTA